MREPIVDMERVEALIAEMSLNQKIGQMVQAERSTISPDEVKAHHIGSVLSGGGSYPGNNHPEDWLDMIDAYWDASLDTPLGIPILYGIDAVHGNNNVRGATVFPHNIGLGCANDPDLMARIAQVTMREVLACGVQWVFAPSLAVARDNRWGRCCESYSEDPEIVVSYAGRFVGALQDDLGEDSVIACAKHWVGDGGTTYGIDQGNTEVTKAELENIHIAPYYPAIEAGVLTIMASYNCWNGDKCHGHEYLLTHFLKDEMGFRGFIVSDWEGISQLSSDYGDAVALSVNAGIDMFMLPETWRIFVGHLRQHVERQTVSMDRIDDAVRRILSVKSAYGLFDRPKPSQSYWAGHRCFGSQEHREVARDAVRKSLVLLKNTDGLLPLDRGARILVAGKSAHNRGYQCGGWTVEWQGVCGNDLIEGGTSIWEGIANVASHAVLHTGGADVDTGAYDVAVVAIGEKPYAEGLGDIRSGDDVVVEVGSQISGLMKLQEAYGESLKLAELHLEDLQTIEDIGAKGIPVVAVLVSGRPLIINRELNAASAFVAAWLPGSEGQGVADVLFGDCDFQGKLSFSWPKSENESVNRGDQPYQPLFPYGYGLSYSD